MRLFSLVALAMVAFAANSVLGRLALAGGGTGPLVFAALRTGSGAAMLLGLCALRGTGPHAVLWQGQWLTTVALAVYMLGFAMAYRALDTGLGALILFGAVQITMFTGALVARERVPPLRWIGALLAFGGLVWLLRPAGTGAPPVLGAALMAAAGAGWGVYSIAGRRATDPTAATAANFLFATPLVVIAALLASGAEPVAAAGVGFALVSGMVTSALGYALWYAILPQVGAARAAVAQLTVPLIAAAGGAAILGEMPGPRLATSAVLVLGGVALSLLPLGRGRQR